MRFYPKGGAMIKKLIAFFMRFILVNVLIFALTSPLVVLYGPFANVRNTVIGAVATSMHVSWLHYFMSDMQINKLLADSHGTSNTNEKISKFNNSHNGDIKLTTISGARFHGSLLEISDPTRVKLGIAETLGTKGQTTSEIAKLSGAIAAVNAGGFADPNGTGNGRLPVGIVIHNGNFLSGENTTRPVQLVGLTNQGVLVTGVYTIRQIKAMHITEGISFYPTLIMNGKKQIAVGDGGWGIAPRTAIGQKADGTILLLVIDGRQTDSIGATLVDVQNILYDNGAIVAANLDGGSSTTMYYKGKVVNHPCDLLGERSIPTAFVVI
jgi:exopolysaccharide biosynthesis protein